MSEIVHFSRRYRFSASHRLHVEDMSAEENRQTFGKCNNPHGHGHNYVVQVTVRGPIDQETGMVINLVDLDSIVNTRVIQRFNLENLNVDALFEREVSSTENLCRAVWNLLKDPAVLSRMGSAELALVRIEETSNNFFEYAGGEDKLG